MNTQSKLKVFKSGGYKYLYIYYKLGNNILRIPTQQTVKEGMMNSELLFNSKVIDYEKKNREITQLKHKVDDYIHVKLKEHFPTISQTECKKFIQERYMRGDLFSGKRYEPLLPQTETKSLIQYVEDYIEFRKIRNTPRNTLKEFTTILNRVRKFDTSRSQTTYFEDINLSWSDEFEKHLLQRKYQSGTIEKTYTILITVLYHYYERKDELAIQLSDKFQSKSFKRGSKSKNLANPLTLEQFKVLYNHKFDEDHLEKTRIRFCFQCSTGLRFSDMHRIEPKFIDNGRIVIQPKKTQHLDKKPVYIDLNKYSNAILESLEYSTSSFKIENAPYNRNIKDVFKRMQQVYSDMKFKDNYGSHCARDTFISICVTQGVDFKTILGWTGQTSYTVMDRYIFATDEYKVGQMNKAFDE